MSGVESYLDALASAEPTPGGGSAAAMVAETSAALVAMVAGIAAVRSTDADKRRRAGEIAAAAQRLRARLGEARADDERAYARVVAAQALPKATDAERATRLGELQAALAGAAQAPLETATLARDAVELARQTLAVASVHLASDLVCAAEFGAAAVRAAAANVLVNHRALKDRDLVARQANDLATIERESDAAYAAVCDGASALFTPRDRETA